MQLPEKGERDFEKPKECGSDARAHPSTMFDGTETAARRICAVMPYISSSGKLLVARYVCKAISSASANALSFE